MKTILGNLPKHKINRIRITRRNQLKILSRSPRNPSIKIQRITPRPIIPIRRQILQNHILPSLRVLKLNRELPGLFPEYISFVLNKHFLLSNFPEPLRKLPRMLLINPMVVYSELMSPEIITDDSDILLRIQIA